MISKVNEAYDILITGIQKENNEQKLEDLFIGFYNGLIEFCTTETKLFHIFRLLSRMKSDLKFRSSKGLDLCLCSKIIDLIDSELEILTLKMNNPAFLEYESNKDLVMVDLLNWTGDKIDLVELIYAIAKYVNGGKASIRKIAQCFEYIFQIKIGNYYDKLSEINIRKKNTCRFLNSLPKNLEEVLDEVNSR